MSELRHAEKTFLLRKLLFQVQNELKLGWPEAQLFTPPAPGNGTGREGWNIVHGLHTPQN